MWLQIIYLLPSHSTTETISFLLTESPTYGSIPQIPLYSNITILCDSTYEFSSENFSTSYFIKKFSSFPIFPLPLHHHHPCCYKFPKHPVIFHITSLKRFSYNFSWFLPYKILFLQHSCMKGHKKDIHKMEMLLYIRYFCSSEPFFYLSTES